MPRPARRSSCRSCGDVDDDRRLQPFAGTLGEQRDVEDDDVVGRRQLLDAPVHLGAHRGVDDLVQIGQRLGVAERFGCDRGTVQLAVRPDDLGAETFGQRDQDRRAGPLHVADDLIGIDDHRPTGGEHRGHGRLPRTDAAGQTDEDQRLTPSMTKGWSGFGLGFAAASTTSVVSAPSSGGSVPSPSPPSP